MVVVGAGAAGLAAAIFCGRAAPGARVVCLDGAKKPGAKILVSGGGRCNVTNRIVAEADFWGGSSRVVRSVLRAFPVARAAAFFGELGVALHEEEDGKLFPDANRARAVLDALLTEAARLGIAVEGERRVSAIERDGEGFVVSVASGARYESRAVVLATGGRSLPKTGSDGGGYALAARLGHGLVDTTPALAPLLLDDGYHATLSGVTQPAAIAVRIDGRLSITLSGSLLWTHFGASGPLVLNASRHWHRAVLAGRSVDLLLNSCPGETFEAVDGWLQEQQRLRPKASIPSVLSARLPATIASAWVLAAGIDGSSTMAHLDREARRALVHVLTAQRLQVRDSRGYNYAEVTAGGVPLAEIDPATMESRVCSGVYLVGEILDVDGRLGGFNFQWAWSSGFVAGNAVARALATVPAKRPAPG